MNTRTACMVALLLAASGCGSGGSGNGGVPISNPPPPPPPPPSESGTIGGLWTGSIFWGSNGSFPGGSLNVRALMTETGEFRWVLSEVDEPAFSPQSEQIFGRLTAIDYGVQTGLDRAIWMAALGPGNPSGEIWADFGMEGMYSGGEEIGATFWSNLGNADQRWGDVSLNYHSLYEQDSSLEILAGTYVTDTDTLTIDSLGAVFYQSSADGCTGNGTAEVIDPDFNMYRLSVQLANCTAAVRNGYTYSGLAYIGVNNEPGGGFLNDTIEMALSASYVDEPGPSVHIPWNFLAHKQ